MKECKICKEQFDSTQFVSDWAQQMEEHCMCHSCNFWRDMLEKDSLRPEHTWCVIDGTHYVIEPDEPNAAFQGFGGAEFQIEFNDGHKVVTHNLWCQGEPKGYWREKFPDNARFERNLKWRKIGECSYLI